MFIFLFFVLFKTFSQDHESSSQVDEEIHAHRNNVEIYLGNTYNTGYKSNFATFGLDYEYRLKSTNYKLGLSVLADYEFGYITQPGEAHKERHSEFLVTPVLNCYPLKQFKVYAGGGLLFEKNHTQLVSRTGLAYEFEIHHRFLVIPSISADLGKDYAALLAGVALGIGFR